MFIAVRLVHMFASDLVLLLIASDLVLSIGLVEKSSQKIEKVVRARKKMTQPQQRGTS